MAVTQVVAIVDQLCNANESNGGHPIVIMAELEKQHMDEEISKHETRLRGSRVICRCVCLSPGILTSALVFRGMALAACSGTQGLHTDTRSSPSNIAMVYFKTRQHPLASSPLVLRKCRSGNPLLSVDLAKVSIHTARAIIVVAGSDDADQSDARMLRVVLSLMGVHDKLKQDGHDGLRVWHCSEFCRHCHVPARCSLFAGQQSCMLLS